MGARLTLEESAVLRVFQNRNVPGDDKPRLKFADIVEIIKTGIQAPDNILPEYKDWYVTETANIVVKAGLNGLINRLGVVFFEQETGFYIFISDFRLLDHP